MKYFLSILLFLGLILIAPQNVMAVRCIASDGTVTGTGPCAPGTEVAEISDFETIFARIISIAGILLMFAFFIMLVMGGFRFLLSGGDPKAVQAAKGTITWAIVGIAFFALSFTILLLIQAFTGVELGVFKLSGY